MYKMEKWFRVTLFATALMNIGGAFSFIPANSSAREMLGFPASHPLYLWILAVWIFAFGLCYLWMAIKQEREWLFIAIGAIGKLSFFFLLKIFWLLGEIPFRSVLGGAGDFVFGCLFVFWLIKNRKTPVNE